MQTKWPVTGQRVLWFLPWNKWISHSTCRDAGKRCEWVLKNSHRMGHDKLWSEPIRHRSAGNLTRSPPHQKSNIDTTQHSIFVGYIQNTIPVPSMIIHLQSQGEKARPWAFNDGQRSVSSWTKLRWKEGAGKYFLTITHYQQWPFVSGAKWVILCKQY